MEEAMSILFEGSIHVYLQGKNALLPIKTEDNQVTYCIGTRKTRLLLKDYRSTPVKAAQSYMQGKTGFEFADIFNQPAKAKVNIIDEKKVEIELYDSQEVDHSPTLWLGVFDDNLMPNIDTEWEFLRPINVQSTAFAGLVCGEK
jgi:hypothetical protein